MAQRPGIIVYNKEELAGLDRSQKKIIRAWDSSTEVLFQNAKEHQSIAKLLRVIKKGVKGQGISVRGSRILILGMPNVGKSTILNALRHLSLTSKKAAKTGAQPGITRSTKSIFKILDDPTSYVIDTPGVMVPFVSDSQTMLKLGLVHSIKESVLDPITLADYLLFQLNRQSHDIYSRYYDCQPTNDIHNLLDHIGKRKGKLKKGGEIDHDAAGKMFVQEYRNGTFGSFCLDEIFPEALKERIDAEGQYLSKSQVRRGMTVKTAEAD